LPFDHEVEDIDQLSCLVDLVEVQRFLEVLDLVTKSHPTPDGNTVKPACDAIRVAPRSLGVALHLVAHRPATRADLGLGRIKPSSTTERVPTAIGLLGGDTGDRSALGGNHGRRRVLLRLVDVTVPGQRLDLVQASHEVTPQAARDLDDPTIQVDLELLTGGEVSSESLGPVVGHHEGHSIDAERSGHLGPVGTRDRHGVELADFKFGPQVTVEPHVADLHEFTDVSPGSRNQVGKRDHPAGIARRITIPGTPVGATGLQQQDHLPVIGNQFHHRQQHRHAVRLEFFERQKMERRRVLVTSLVERLPLLGE